MLPLASDVETGGGRRKDRYQYICGRCMGSAIDAARECKAKGWKLWIYRLWWGSTSDRLLTGQAGLGTPKVEHLNVVNLDHTQSDCPYRPIWAWSTTTRRLMTSRSRPNVHAHCVPKVPAPTGYLNGLYSSRPASWSDYTRQHV